MRQKNGGITWDSKFNVSNGLLDPENLSGDEYI